MRTAAIAMGCSILCAVSLVHGQTAAAGDTAATEAATGAATGPAVVYGKAITTEIHAGQMVTYKAGGREIPAYMVMPKVAGEKAVMPSVIVVPDIFGMTEWIKGQADSLAKQGYAVLVPNLFSRVAGAEKGLTAQEAYVAYDETPDAQMRDDLSAAIEFLETEGKPMAGQPLGIVGYDMGGVYAMMLAGNDLRVSAAVNYYGRILYSTTTRNRPMSPVENLFNLHAPLLSFYGGNDPQVPEEHVRALESRLSHNPNQTYYEVVRYPGVGHGFLVPTRQGYDAVAAGKAAERTRDFLAQYLRAEPKKAEE